jgi:hypothetical protein
VRSLPALSFVASWFVVFHMDLWGGNCFNPSIAHQHPRSSEHFLGRNVSGVHATCTTRRYVTSVTAAEQAPKAASGVAYARSGRFGGTWASGIDRMGLARPLGAETLRL